jgi:hypothetical protein
LSAATGCGSSEQPPDPRTAVEDVVRKTLTENDPSWCEAAATSRFLEQSFGQSGSDPLQQCRFDAVLPGDPSAREVEFESVRLEDRKAIATASLIGGSGDGSTVTIELIRAEDRWKFDHLADIQIDRARFDAAARTETQMLGINERDANCAVARLRRIYNTDELERAYVAGRTEAFSAAQAPCLSRESMVRFLAIAIQKGAPKGIPSVILDCVGRTLARGLSTDELRTVFAGPDQIQGYFERVVRDAGRRCARQEAAGLLPEGSPS